MVHALREAGDGHNLPEVLLILNVGLIFQLALPGQGRKARQIKTQRSVSTAGATENPRDPPVDAHLELRLAAMMARIMKRIMAAPMMKPPQEAVAELEPSGHTESHGHLGHREQVRERRDSEIAVRAEERRSHW